MITSMNAVNNDIFFAFGGLARPKVSIDAIRRAIHGRYGVKKKGPTFVLA